MIRILVKFIPLIDKLKYIHLFNKYAINQINQLDQETVGFPTDHLTCP